MEALTVNDKHLEMLNRFTRLYTDVLSRLDYAGPKSYGFEYEFLPAGILTADDVDDVSRVLIDLGLTRQGDVFLADNGFLVAFEPGGQIEYCSPPLFAKDHGRFDALMVFIQQTNEVISRRLGIDYIGTDYMAGRASAPLCLTSDRYIQLHDRLSKVDSRGLEMMKGTASIHLHVLISEFEQILPLFNFLCRMTAHDAFKMSAQRQDIWRHTDASRCGPPPCCFEKLASSVALIRRLIDFALHAEVLGENVAFIDSTDASFDAFLYHMTTLFTDVRFNLKGPTLELRTMDSMPIDRFRTRWEKFIDLIENLPMTGDL